MNIYDNATQLVGKTPLMRLHAIERKYSLKAQLFAKLECFNPYSVKDRVALNIIREAERSGALKKGGTIVEPTSGNTGIGLAFAGAVLGYKVVMVMPSSMSIERRKILAALGAEVVLTDAKLGMQGALDEAERIAKERGAIIAGQFDNPANPAAHVATTAEEIYADLDGKADIFVAAIGTGGTVTGCAMRLKQLNPSLKAYGVEPASSPLLTKGYAGAHKIQGAGANFVPKVLDLGYVDGIIDVTNEDAYDKARVMARAEGLLVGISSGSALHAAIELAQNPDNEGKNIVMIMPDSGERYISTDLYDEA